MNAEGSTKRAPCAIARVGVYEERSQGTGVLRFLNCGWLKIVELGEDEVLQLRIAVRHMDIERGPALTQKYL